MQNPITQILNLLPNYTEAQRSEIRCALEQGPEEVPAAILTRLKTPEEGAQEMARRFFARRNR